MRRTWLIAWREYTAFVSTVGFWLSLLTLPLIIFLAALAPVMMHKTEPNVTVSVLDLTGEGLTPRLEAIVSGADADKASIANQAIRGAVDPKARYRDLDETGGIVLVPLPQSLKGLALEPAEARLKEMMVARTPEVSAVVIAFKNNESLGFHVWSSAKSKGKVTNKLKGGLDALAFERLVAASSVDAQTAQAIRTVKADITNLTPLTNVTGGKSDNMMEMIKTRGPHLVGALISYISWIAIFSSSVILLGSVIEEKASKVMEVLLSSASTGEILIGKVGGVAMVMLTVFLIWVVAISSVLVFGAQYLPPSLLGTVRMVISGLFQPWQLALMLVYFAGGYLMYGIGFAAVGAFCETQKDAQAIIGPIMIVLMVPMLSLPAAIAAPDLPAVQYLSYIPIYTPFLMPIRLSQDLPWWEIAGTLLAMWLVGVLLIRLGSRAFRQGALGGGKFSWKLMGQLIGGKTAD
jgi:ABC-2 type transport system permease protein